MEAIRANSGCVRDATQVDRPVAFGHAQSPRADASYEERAVVRPGERWKSDEPFPLVIDPAEVF
ncbi:MAG TPA: hypothetical protein VGP31_17690 [Planosporangium sp.]|nr:hypothetical protein [Planosporangium sp.]